MQLRPIGIASVLIISLASHDTALAQRNAADSNSSLFGKNSTALGNDPLNDSGNSNNNISNTENAQPEENFGLEGNNELFIENNTSPNPVQQRNTPANQGGAPEPPAQRAQTKLT